MNYKWAVIGAGPAGIAIVGSLLDGGVCSDEIVWVDPYFAVGDFGTLWRNVPSNTKVKLFLKFVNTIKSFSITKDVQNYALFKINPENTCKIQLMADVLHQISMQLQKKVVSYQNIATQIKLYKNKWQIILKKDQLIADKVVLAIGAEAKILDYPFPHLSLAQAMDDQLINTIVKPRDTIAVFGSSHSAILVLKNLLTNGGANKVINFYRSALRFAVDLGGQILFDDTGLKGTTADWAKMHICGELPKNLIRIPFSRENVMSHAQTITSAVYAIGFKRKKLPFIEGVDRDNYCSSTGIIAPGLFGFGIAYPEVKNDYFGIVESKVGLWKFIQYAQKVLPIWQKYNA